MIWMNLVMKFAGKFVLAPRWRWSRWPLSPMRMNSKLSHNQRIACSRGLSAGKLNTATCKSYAYIFNTKTSEYFRCSVSLALTRDNKEVINVQTDGGCIKKPRIFETDFTLFVRRDRDRGAEHQLVLRPRRLRDLGQRHVSAEGPRLHHHLFRARLRHFKMPRHDVPVIAVE